MTRPRIVSFADAHVDGAAELLAARHRAHRAAEPLLSPRYEDPAAAREEIEALRQADAVGGAAAERDGRVAGFVLGIRKAESWGANVWVDPAGFAAEEPELVRDLYAAAAARWAEAGLKAHYALVPALPELLEPWYRLGFGRQQGFGIQEVHDAPWPEGTRPMRREDFDELIRLAPLLAEHQADSPVFSGFNERQSEEELRAELEEDLANESVGSLVAERDGRIVGHFFLAPVELSSAHTSLARADGTVLLAFAISDPEVRGTGAGLALTDASFAWAHERGYASMTTDWRETNLLSSRFWPARGFRPSFYRLHRLIA